MIDNERKILHVIARNGSMTKKEIADSLNLSWATVVKITKRLEQSGYIKFSGRPERKNVQGVDSAVFALKRNNPTAIGIDLGYSETSIIVSNLSDQILYQKTLSNPTLSTVEDIASFLESCIEETLEANREGWEIHGVGIGAPAFLLPDKRDIYPPLQEILNDRFHLPIHIDSSVRGFALYKRFKHNIEGDYVVLTVRTGIGLGIILNNSLYRGESHMAGEISHTFIPGLEGLCRCGQTGCLETGLNYHILSEDYYRIAAEAGEPVNVPNPPAVLMKLAAEGIPQAREILERRSGILARAIMPLLLILNISRITIAGQFGDGGALFANMVDKALSEMLSLRIDHKINYEKLEVLDFAIGASHMVLEKFIY